jgi:hypothetical protein
MRQFGRTAVVERITSRPDGNPARLSRGAAEDLGMSGFGPCRACMTRLGEEKQAHDRGRSLLVGAEPVGDRSRLPSPGDPQLGQDP